MSIPIPAKASLVSTPNQARDPGLPPDSEPPPLLLPLPPSLEEGSPSPPPTLTYGSKSPIDPNHSCLQAFLNNLAIPSAVPPPANPVSTALEEDTMMFPPESNPLPANPHNGQPSVLDLLLRDTKDNTP